MSKKIVQEVVVLGTGGTIAGTAASSLDNLGYTAARLGVSELLASVPGLTKLMAGRSLLTEQVAQVDSKDMSFAIWQKLALRVQYYLMQRQVSGVLITHGTDTLEEAAYFLHAVLPAELLAKKPVVLTCAMRPASSAAPDGPQNMLDSVAVLTTPGACGVLVVCAGTVHGALEVQKVHSYRLEAFNSGDAGPLGYVEEASFRLIRNWPLAPVETACTAINTIAEMRSWPRVEIVMNYAGASAAMVDALLVPREGVPTLLGLVVAATGNGTLHHEFEAALLGAQATGVKVVIASRCANGRVLPTANSVFADSQGLSPVKARIALMLSLLQ
jgi:L-asparaginase